MSTEQCKLCGKDSTPCIHINSHICGDCYHNDKWIKVSERLPDQDQYVLTYAKDHRPRYQIGFYSTFSKQWLKTSSHYVEYWMELPKSPKDDE